MACNIPKEHRDRHIANLNKHAAGYLKTMYDCTGAKAIVILQMPCGCVVSHSSMADGQTESVIMAAAASRDPDQPTQ